LNPYFEMLRGSREDRTAETIALAIAWDDAVSLAHRERTGSELGPGERYSESDAARATQIISLYPKKEGA
jgi:hypothetical protein